MAIFLFFQASAKQRVTALILVPLLTLALFAVLPSQNRARLLSLFSSDSADQADHAVATEAAESMQSRSYLFRKSLQYTFQHPLLGVGPGQFGNFEGQESKTVGLHGSWHETHNAYTQISSECGIPAVICMLAGLFGAFSMVRKALKKARALGNVEIAQACLCYMTAFIGYMTTSIFLANGYRFMLPALISFAIAIHFASEREFARPRPQFHKSPVPTA
jgi:O-antigen ligase